MLWTKTFIPTLKEVPQEAESESHRLMLRAGLIRMLMAGVYTYLPLGLKVLKNIEEIIRQEMNAIGASELLLPALQPKELWSKTGREKVIGEVMIKFTDRRGRHMCLGPTHEEVVTDLAKSFVSSYKQLPFTLYQIQTKFRDEIRPRFGLIRSCEFIMKDAYSFDKDEDGLKINYALMLDAYNKIFSRCGLKFYSVEADSGVMGGSISHEFMVPASEGEDAVLLCEACGHAVPFKDSKIESCPKCGKNLVKVNTLEVGHIFQLGTKYSSSLEANFVDQEGKLKHIIMGCYGIGVSRLLPAIIEQNRDKDGIIWPKGISPFKVILLPLDVTDENIRNASLNIYNELEKKHIDTLLDDRDERAGVKFKDADLLGITKQVIIGKEFLKSGSFELKDRINNQKISLDKDALLKALEG